MEEIYPLIAEMLEINGSAQITVSGISMQPMVYNKRDTVVLKKAKLPLKKYDLPFYRMDNGKFIMHRVIKVHKDGTYSCRGDNCWTCETPIRDDQIIGVVKSFTRKGKKIDVDGSFGYFVYTRLWPFFHHFKKWYKTFCNLKSLPSRTKTALFPEKVSITRKDGKMSTITYRAAKKSDMDSLIQAVLKHYDYEASAFDANITSRSWFLSEDGKTFYENLMKNHFVYLALEDKKIVGYVCGTVIEKKSDNFPVGTCKGIYIDPDYRGFGIATELLSKLKDFCKEKNCNHLKVDIYEENVGAEALYRKSGFKDYTKCLMCKIEK